MKNQGDSLRHQRPAPTKEGLARFDLLRRGRQGKAGSPGIYSLSHGVGFQPNAVTAPSGRRLQFGILQIQEAFTRPQEGAEERAPKKDLWEEGEHVLSWQRHGVALTTCELGNGALFAPFPDRARILPREMSRHRSKAARNTAADLWALRRRGGKEIEFTPSVTVSA